MKSKNNTILLILLAISMITSFILGFAVKRYVDYRAMQKDDTYKIIREWDNEKQK